MITSLLVFPFLLGVFLFQHISAESLNCKLLDFMDQCKENPVLCYNSERGYLVKSINVLWNKAVKDAQSLADDNQECYTNSNSDVSISLFDDQKGFEFQPYLSFSLQQKEDFLRNNSKAALLMFDSFLNNKSTFEAFYFYQKRFIDFLKENHHIPDGLTDFFQTVCLGDSAQLREKISMNAQTGNLIDENRVNIGKYADMSFTENQNNIHFSVNYRYESLYERFHEQSFRLKENIDLNHFSIIDTQSGNPVPLDTEQYIKKIVKYSPGDAVIATIKIFTTVNEKTTTLKYSIFFHDKERCAFNKAPLGKQYLLMKKDSKKKAQGRFITDEDIELDEENIKPFFRCSLVLTSKEDSR